MTKKKEDFYRQCRMTKPTDDGLGNYDHVAWIPEKTAKKGKVIGFKDDDGEWNEGWTVKLVGAERMSGDILLDREKTQRDYLESKGGVMVACWALDEHGETMQGARETA